MLTARIEQWTAQVEARGEARGEAKGKAEAILELVRDGVLPRQVAEVRLRHLQEQGVIDQRLLDASLQRLNRRDQPAG